MSSEPSHLPTCVPVPLGAPELAEIVSKAKDWALLHGAGMRRKDDLDTDSMSFAPFVLLPSPFLREDFERITKLQTSLNELTHRVACDAPFLRECLRAAVEGDDFTAKLFRIFEAVENEGVAQTTHLGLLRSDYMMQSLRNNKLKQVEINSIATSLAGVSSTISKYNRYVLEELGYHEKLKNLPDNGALEGLNEGMVDAWKLYGSTEAVVLFVVEDVTYNICDQRFHEFDIRDRHPEVKVLRRTLTDLAGRGKLNRDKEFVVDGYVVAVVYYRTAYEPDQYNGKPEWDARLLIERSKAIKCPTIHYQLAGTKKVQQELAKPGAVERFIDDPDTVKAIRDCFVGLYGLDYDEAGEAACRMAIEEPERFVLKPQREGGGNNVYGAEVRDAVLRMSGTKERSGWILMERIFPPIVEGYILRPGQGAKPPPLTEMVSELGVYGVILGDSERIIVNRQAGHMLRTKAATADEGGVAAGLGALDSPYLID